jgi:hypothetical protein
VGGLVGFCPIEELLYAALLHPAIEAYGLQHPPDDGLQYLGHEVADDQYYDRTDELGDVAQERAQRVLQRPEQSALCLLPCLCPAPLASGLPEASLEEV